MSEDEDRHEKKPIEQNRRSRHYERFHWTQRVAHALLLTSFSLLGITGLPQKYSSTGWAQAMIQFFGGIETTRLIHHVCAIVLMFLAIYHILDIGYKIFVRRTRLSMLPGIQDMKDAIQAFLYNLGFTKKRPQMGRYTFEEKAEYWALIWGTVIMGDHRFHDVESHHHGSDSCPGKSYRPPRLLMAAKLFWLLWPLLSGICMGFI